MEKPHTDKPSVGKKIKLANLLNKWKKSWESVIPVACVKIWKRYVVKHNYVN